MDVIIYFVTYTLTLLIGVSIGYMLSGRSNVADIQKKISRTIHPVKLGAVNRPSQQDIEERGTPLGDEKKAMSETFERIINEPPRL